MGWCVVYDCGDLVKKRIPTYGMVYLENSTHELKIVVIHNKSTVITQLVLHINLNVIGNYTWIFYTLRLIKFSTSP